MLLFACGARVRSLTSCRRPNCIHLISLNFSQTRLPRMCGDGLISSLLWGISQGTTPRAYRTLHFSSLKHFSELGSLSLVPSRRGGGHGHGRRRSCRSSRRGSSCQRRERHVGRFGRGPFTSRRALEDPLGDHVGKTRGFGLELVVDLVIHALYRQRLFFAAACSPR